MKIGMGRKKIKLGDLLVEANAITNEQLYDALKKQKELGKKLGETLIELGYISQELLNATLTQQLGIDFIELRAAKLDEDAIALFPESLARKHNAIPIGFDETNGNVLRVAMVDPMDIIAMDDMAIVTNMQIDPLLTTQEELDSALAKYYGNAQAMEMADKYRKEREAAEVTEEEENIIDDEVDNSPIVMLVKSIIEQGVRQRASDIHIEPLEMSVRVRFRIDGVLKKVMTYDYSLLSAICARIKIIGGMDIAEKRKPQDGRISIMVDRKEYDIRVSMLPTVYGEKTVMRITSKEGLTKPKSALGFAPEDLAKFDGILSNPHGIILVTGPTGSGKSTTLYTSLSELNTEDVNIITVEDPVEANVDGINQVQVNVKADMTFAAALRSILRQDPDIIMIGEIRDGETAQIAVKASITGHLVVSTLHTNSAASSVTRVVDMGIEPYLIGDALVGVIAQRLVRRLCTCKMARHAEVYENRMLGKDEDEQVVVYDPVGCPICNNTGYLGRIGVYEIMPITHSLRVVISRGGTADQIEEQALKEGMKTLRMSARELVLKGTTSMSEMKKIVYEAEDSM